MSEDIPRSTPTLPLSADLLSGSSRTGVSYAQILEQVDDALAKIVAQRSETETVRLTVDFPPEQSEVRAGTLVSRYENNLNFVRQLAARLGGTTCKDVGPTVEIRDNINPQGGGEYLTDDEVMIGVRITNASRLPGKPNVTMLINAGVDAGTLKQTQEYEREEREKMEVIVLVNCGLERVSWFAKVGFAKYLESFEAAYYFKVIAAGGWLLKCGVAPWTVFAALPKGIEVLDQVEKRPSLVDVEAQVRVAVALSSPS